MSFSALFSLHSNSYKTIHSFNIHKNNIINYRNNIIRRFCIENSPLDGNVQSGQSAIMWYAG